MVASRSACAFVLAIGCFCSTGEAADLGGVTGPTVAIERQGDRLTVRIAHAPLHLVLAELHRQAGIHSQLLDPADEDTISETFADKPLVEAIARLVNGRSFLIDYAASRGAQATAQAAPLQLVILPRANAISSVGRDMTASAEKSPTTINDLTQAMLDPDENVRARAQEQFEQALESERQSAAGTPQQRR